MKRFQRAGQRGVMLIWVAFVLMILIGIIGFSVDVGLGTYVSNQLQAGADAAALAGARMVRTDIGQARLDAQAIGGSNKASRQFITLALNETNDDAGDIVIGRYSRTTRTFTPQLNNPNAVQVNARRTAESGDGPLPLAFGPIFGVRTANVQRQATAMIGGGTGQGIICLSPDDPKAFYVRGSAIVSVNGGDIQVDSTAANAADLQGSKFIVDAPSINICGDIDLGGGDIGDTVINPGAPYKPDPLAYVPEPTWNPASDKVKAKITGGAVTLTPGYYSGGFDFSGGDITLDPGIYVLGGAGFNLRGGTNLTANGVMIFIDSGPVSINGTGNIVMTPPNPELHSFPDAQTYENILFFQARDNTTPSLINGTAGLDLSGSLYFPENAVAVSGTSDKLGNQFIAYTMEIAGNSNLTIIYNGDEVAPGNRIFLVK